MLIQLSSAALMAAEVAEEHAEGTPPLVYGAVIFGIFMVLMFATMAFTSLGHRHEATPEHVDPQRQFPNKHDHGQGIPE
ncbi:MULTISPECIES: hypothetical protein [Arthrobacter]|uniref:Uncharacterized protein n=1 Tax=Arthrobacter caoxuetaonis TaxID=2886935 RepID=A0A9X1MD04_9MICC|nr:MULTISPECIES: hypothetical protein [Arthrobacter]MCC3282591.1 hypothetical protein [Arthrobacter caoxuetaonis]MCC3297729.1 hypothetical protein [Arthrobacter caoxuetaonis]MCC9193729.1 hypothetical protein [Arthrobacter sp. zg-Y916]USQ56071.1 hypothetical protein NF551_09825 [Arthrobacter caoxuetaonis]